MELQRSTSGQKWQEIHTGESGAAGGIGHRVQKAGVRSSVQADANRQDGEMMIDWCI